MDSLGDRMKGYEGALRTQLPWRLPVILRVDGRAFHTFTRHMERPFDERFARWMNQVALALCKEIPGACLAYVQSDEISVLIHSYRRLQTRPWFENDVQKMVSVAASVATETMARVAAGATFDARVFVLPEAEVTNYFLWRQNDWTRNSLQMMALSLYSVSELRGKSQSDMHEMIHQAGKNWNELPTSWRRGRCAVRETVSIEGVERHRWVIDNEIPIWRGEGRDYIERLLPTEE